MEQGHVTIDINFNINTEIDNHLRMLDA